MDESLPQTNPMTEPGWHLYWLPFAPVSLNDAYGIDSRHRAKASKFLKTQYLRMKEMMGEAFEEQDAERGKPNYRLYEVSYLFLYTEDELFTVSLPSRYQRFHDPLTQRKDISNSFKLVEDALFEYLGVDDSRVFAISGAKAACARLPFPVESYGDDKAHKGNILVAVKEKRDFYSLPDVFAPLLGERFVPSSMTEEQIAFAPRRDETLPSWYECPGAGNVAPDLVTIDDTETVIDFEKAREAKAHRRATAAIVRKALGRRVTWFAHWRGKDEKEIAKAFFDPSLPKKRFYKVVGGPKNAKEWRFPEEKWDAYMRSLPWAVLRLREEASESNLRSMAALRNFANSLIRVPGYHPKVLLYIPDSCGGEVYPFHEHDCDIDVVVLKRSATGSIARYRFDQDRFILRKVYGVSRIGDVPKGLAKDYEAVVCLGSLDLAPDPKRLVSALGNALSPGGSLVLSYSFKRTEGRKSTIAYPWVRDADILGWGNSGSSEMQKFLTQKRSLGFSVDKDWAPSKEHAWRVFRKPGTLPDVSSDVDSGSDDAKVVDVVESYFNETPEEREARKRREARVGDQLDGDETYEPMEV